MRKAIRHVMDGVCHMESLLTLWKISMKPENHLLARRLIILVYSLVILGKLITDGFLRDMNSDISDTIAARCRCKLAR